MTLLSVNINKIALIRNSRSGNYPDLIRYAEKCIEYGAAGITVHPRPDQRHIRASDIAPLTHLLAHFPAVEFNIEGNPFASAQGSYPGFVALVEQARPHQCTLVPDNNEQLTSDHGFNLHKDGDKLLPIIEQLHSYGCRVSVFMEPDCEQIKLAHQLGADRIELYTGPYAAAHPMHSAEYDSILAAHQAAAEFATALGLGVNAGHDLNLLNLPAYLSVIPDLLEVSIGHALTVDALEMGLQRTMQAYIQALVPT